MKSKRAQKFLDELIDQLGLLLSDVNDRQLVKVKIDDHGKEQLRSAMTHAAELAEQEAEDRLRKNAIKAYCSECSCYKTGVCALDPDNCAPKLLFVQTMNEE